MVNRSSTWAFIALFILGSILLGTLFWANTTLARNNPGGNDFLSRWLGTRRFLTRGWSPYSEETSLAIQEMMYGRAANENEDQVLFVYPLFSILIFAPYALVSDYAIARGLWMTTLEILLILITAISIRLTRWRPPAWLLAILFLFSVLWYHGIRPVINGNPSVWVAFLIIFALYAIRVGADGRAGFLLAMTMIKPQMVILLVPFVLIWAASRRQWTLIVSFVASLVLLCAAAMLLIPDWILQNIRQVLAYPGYTLAGTPGAILATWLPGIGNQLGWLLTAIMAVILFIEWRSALKQEPYQFIWTAALTLVVTNLIGIRTATANYVAMFPALVFVFAVWDDRWKRLGRLLVVFWIIALMIGLWVLFFSSLDLGAQPIQSPIMFIPLPVFLLICLYWTKWWAIQAPTLFVDRIKTTPP